MKEYICDICKENKADRHFKFKERKAYAMMDEHGFIHKSLYWIRLDICEHCFDKIVNGKNK